MQTVSVCGNICGAPGPTGANNTYQRIRNVYRKPRLATSLSAAALALPMTALAQTQTPYELETLNVSATRANSAVGETPQKIIVITREEIEQQLAVTSDVSQVLTNLIPSYTPARQKLTSRGETFRGREPLFMIDGIPQSNPLRDGDRDAHNIDVSMIERIEVIYGASAEHGLGATGGIINVVTRRPEGGTLTQHAGVSVTTPLQDYDSDGLGYKLNYRIAGAQGSWDYLAAATYQSRGLFYDAEGRAIGVDNTQGDIMDSDSYDVLLKLGYWLDDHQNVELMVNRYALESNYDYVAVDGDRSAGIPTTSVEGSPAGEPGFNKVLTTALNYRHDALGGNELAIKLYRQEFEARYGGDTYGIFQDPTIAPPPTLFDQSQNESTKVGAKLTLSRDNVFVDTLDLTGGVDLLQDETRQVLVQTGREWVPETTFRNYAPFLQAEWRPVDRVGLQAGVRHEYAELEVDDFRTLAETTLDSLGRYGGVAVGGGNPEFEETLFNAGVIWQVTDFAELFANYSEGFGMPDVGRVLRAVDEEGEDVDQFLNLQPIVTDNREIGMRANWERLNFELSYFVSEAELGSDLKDLDRDGRFEVLRRATEIEGFEATGGYQLSEGQRLEAAYANIDGEADTDRDGEVDTELGGEDISPDQLTLRWLSAWTPKLNTQLQAIHLFDRDFEGSELEFDGYTLVDVSMGYKLPVGRLSAGIANLFNEDYITYYSQAATARADRYFAGRGRTLTVGYDISF